MPTSRAPTPTQDVENQAAILRTAQASASSRAPFVSSLPIPLHAYGGRGAELRQPGRSARTRSISAGVVAGPARSELRPLGRTRLEAQGRRARGSARARPTCRRFPPRRRLRRGRARSAAPRSRPRRSSRWRCWPIVGAPPPLTRTSGTARADARLRGGRAARRPARLFSARSRDGQLEGRGHAGDAGDVLGAGAPARLLAPAVDERLEAQRPRARRARRRPSGRRTYAPTARAGRRRASARRSAASSGA